MQKTLASLAFAAGSCLVCCQSAGAVSAGGIVMKEAATAASMVQFARTRAAHKAHTARSNAATARQKGSKRQQ
jgi:hypothetical protein